MVGCRFKKIDVANQQIFSSPFDSQENRQGKYAIAAKKESNNINNKISFIDEDVNQNTLDNNNKNENGVSFTNEGADVFDTYL